MAVNYEIIKIGSVPNDGTGDPLRVAFDKTNNNFANLSSTAVISSNTYTTGNTAGQVIWEYPANAFTLGSFFIKSNDPGTIDQQDVRLDAQLSANSTNIKFSAYSSTQWGNVLIPGSGYDMDVTSGNVRITVDPDLANVGGSQTLFHFINSSVMFQGSAPAGLPLALDGYVDSELATEVDDVITTEETP
tara:strand:+ start:38 stop:604 length:567 start_codon:yes stop_codon:yes gene_type:complete